MRKWCPEPFDQTAEESSVTTEQAQPFHPEPLQSSCVPEGKNPGFEKDLYLADRHSLWDSMNQVEKDELLEKSREILQVEFEERESGLRRRHEEEINNIRAEYGQRLDNWCREFTSASLREKKRLTVEAAGLSLVLARQIIRETVEIDSEFLARTLETALFKIQDTRPVTAVLHPADAALLSGDPDLMKKLRIDTVIPDRRVEKGGCRLRSGVQEWDATLAGQLTTLTEVVEEALAAEGGLPLISAGGSHDSHLD